jgi:propionaldehyde dehydrogenase
MADQYQVERIVQEVLRELGADVAPAQSTSRETEGPTGFTRPIEFSSSGCDVASPTINQATAEARIAQRQLVDLGLEKRRELIAAMRSIILQHSESLANDAAAETGMGNAHDKKLKIELQARKTPGVEDLVPYSYSGDYGLTLVEPAPFGVIGVITPSTNPVGTVVNNSISMISSGNASVFCVHPAAKNVCLRAADLLSSAIAEAGGPESVIKVLDNPTQETAQDLMQHPDIDVLVITGGGAVVNLGLTSGKRAICAGPGNPPVVVDETAIIPNAARHIVDGSSFDNNIMCTDEKEVFVVDSVASGLRREMANCGGYELRGTEIDRAVKLLVPEDRKGSGLRHVAVNREFIGKDASAILEHLDIKPPAGVKVLFFEAEWDHPLVMAEQMMPVLPIVQCRTVDEAMEKAVIVEHQFHHSFVMHSTSLPNLSKMAQICGGNIFVKNGPNYAGLGFGGEGYTSMTIAGTTGEGITRASTFTRPRRCSLIDYFRII